MGWGALGTFILILLSTGTVMAVAIAILLCRDYLRQSRADAEVQKLRDDHYVRSSL